VALSYIKDIAEFHYVLPQKWTKVNTGYTGINEKKNSKISGRRET
jgi:hypothetical protein